MLVWIATFCILVLSTIIGVTTYHIRLKKFTELDFWRGYHDDLKRAIRWTVLLVSAVGFIVSIMAVDCITSNIGSSREVEYKTDSYIVALQDGSAISGGMFVISTQEYYYYYSKTAENTYRMGRVHTNDTVIIEDSSITPQIRRLFPKVTPFEFKMLMIHSLRTEIIVPPGTVVQQFNLDLE